MIVGLSIGAQTLGRRVATIAVSALTATSLMFPATALARVLVDDQELMQGENSVGGGRATLMDTSLDMMDVTAQRLSVDQDLAINFNGGNDIEDVYVEGSANVQMNFEGSNEVEDTHARDDSNLTVNANGHNEFEEIMAYDNANVTVNVTGSNDFETIEAYDNANVTVRGTDCQRRDVTNLGVDEDDAGVSAERGNVTIDHVTVNIRSKEARVGSKEGSLVIDTSKIASSDNNKYTEVVSGKAMRIVESVIDITGTLHSTDAITIKHSDVKADAPATSYDSSPYRVYSSEGIKLIDEKNGEVKEGTLDGKDVHYVDTDDGNDVDLKADGEPAYYACADKGHDSDDSDDSVSSIAAMTKKIPRTADATNTWAVVALCVAGAAAATTGLAVRRH